MPQAANEPVGHRDRQRAPLRLRGTRPGDRHGDELRSVGGLREIAVWKPVGVEPETHDQLRRGVKPLGPGSAPAPDDAVALAMI